MKEDLNAHIKQRIVIDTASSWVYIGTLEKVTDQSVILSDVDVHDNNDTATSKEIYVFESTTTGVASNRKLTYVNLEYVVSFSRLEDIKKF